MSGTIQARAWLTGTVCLLTAIGLPATRAWAGGHKHKPQLYQAVQGYMLQAPSAAPVEHHHHHHYHDGTTPSPQSQATPQAGQSSPGKGSPQVGAGPSTPQVGMSLPMIQIPQVVPQQTLGLPMLGTAPAAPMQLMPAMTPTLGISPIQQVAMPTLGIAPIQPIQTVSYQVQLGVAPQPQTVAQPASLTPVTVLVPYNRHWLLDCLKR